EKSGVWKSSNGAPWVQLYEAPSEAALEGPQIAAAQGNSSHVAAGNLRGGWESTDGGNTWAYVFDPTSKGCGSQQVIAVAIALDGSLVMSTACGIGHKAAGSSSIDFTSTPDPVLALAVSETKVWARTPRALLVSSGNGKSWSAPIPIPN